MTNTSNMMIDFSDIEEGGGARVRVPAGDYRAKVKSVTFATSQGGNSMFVWIIVGTDGKLKGKELKEYTALTKKALWKLRDLMEAAGVPTPKKAASLKALLDYCKKNVVGKELGITLGDDEFTNDKGKTFVSSKIQDYMDVDDLGDSEPDEDEDDDVEDEDDEDELAGMSRTELKAFIKEKDLEIKVTKSMTDDALRAAIAEAYGGDDEEDEDDEDTDDGLDEMDRAELKAHIKAEKLGVKVTKSMSDDDIRTAIRAEADDEEEEVIEDVDLDEI